MLHLLDARADMRLKLQVILAKMGKSPAGGLISFGYEAVSNDIDLTRILEGRFDNYHFEERLTDGGHVF